MNLIGVSLRVVGEAAPAYLWEDKDVAPFPMVNKGIQPEAVSVC
jgi:hypothetical protein